MKTKFFILIIFCSLNNLMLGQIKVTDNIFIQDSVNETSSKGSINDISWISGYWRGNALGGIAEEIWSSPSAGSMMCAFKLIVDNKIKFYELVVISEIEESLILKIKHFDTDLIGWEEKDEVVTSKLIKVSENNVYFDGFTFERIDENNISVYVLTETNGEPNELIFNYKRVL